MPELINVSTIGAVFLTFVFIAFISYLRIMMILQYLDEGLENPPVRKQLGDKLRAYRDFCQDREKRPYLITTFAVGSVGAVLCWLPLPWILFSA